MPFGSPLDLASASCAWCRKPLLGENLIMRFGGRCLDTKTGDFVQQQREFGTIHDMVAQAERRGFVDFWCPKCEGANRLKKTPVGLEHMKSP